MWLNTKTSKHVTYRDNSESGPWIVPATVQLLAKYAVNSSTVGTLNLLTYLQGYSVHIKNSYRTIRTE